MAVIEYKNENGQVFWKAYVSIKSKVNSSIRVQMSKFNLKTQKQAEREETNLLRECQIEIQRREAKGASWGSVIDSWEDFLKKDFNEHVGEDTRGDYVAALRKHTEIWLKKPAVEIRKLDIQELLSQMKAGGYSNGFQAKFKNTLNRVFLFGIERGQIKGIDRSPTFGISVKKKEEKKPEILNLDQIRKLLGQGKMLDHKWYPIWATALLTGLRNGELYALLWSDVDWENRQLSITKSFNCRKKVIKSTKSGDWRTVPISNELMELFKELKSNSGDRPSILPRFGVWSKGHQAGILRQFCIGIGLPSVKFHTLRACFATQLIRSGVAPIRIQKICGWKDLETMQRYIRLAGIEIEGATESLKVLPEIDVIGRAGSMFSGDGLDEREAVSKSTG